MELRAISAYNHCRHLRYFGYGALHEHLPAEEVARLHGVPWHAHLGEPVQLARDVRALMEEQYVVVEAGDRAESYDFPATNRIGQDCCGYSDTFVVKLDATGGLAYATRIGGGGEDYANAIAVDAQGRARIVGNTMSADFPVVNPLRTQLGGDVAFHSTDGGQTWSPSSVGLRASHILALDSIRHKPAPCTRQRPEKGTSGRWMAARHGRKRACHCNPSAP